MEGIGSRMSCCFKWISKTKHSAAKSIKHRDVVSVCPIENIPVNIIVKILGDKLCLTVEDLKSARLVCKLWDAIISEIQLLTRKSLALAFRGDDSLLKIKYSKLFPEETKKFWIFVPHFLRRKIPLHGSTIRIQDSAASLVRDWLQFFKAKNITCLELDASILPADVLTDCISTSMKNLESLTLSDTFIYDPHRISKRVDKLIKKSFRRLKTLTVIVKHSWFYANIAHTRNRAFPVPNFLSTPLINTLVTLDIKVTDSGSAEIDRRGHFQTLFKSVGLIVKNNAKTLQNIAIVTYDVLTDRSYQCYVHHPKIQIFPSMSEAPSEGQQFLFDYFLEEIKVLSWIDYGLQLKKLTLAFRLLSIKRTSMVDDTLKPFLKSMTSLQEISISQIFTQNRQYFNEVFGCLFNRCKCHFVEVHNVKPALEIEGELQGTLQYYLARTYPEHLGPFIRQFNETVEKIKTKLETKQGFVQSWDITSELATPNVTLIARFSKWKSLWGVGFLRDNINFLTKIKIHHGVHSSKDKLVMKDEDLQTIFSTADLLTELSFQHCNLHGVTDCGLTGISRAARARMQRTNIFVQEPFDLVGVPLSNLKKLRSLQLGDAGRGIGRISTLFAFDGLEKLDSCKMQFVHNVTAVVPTLKLHFPYKRVVTTFPTFQYETYEKIKL